MLDLHAIVNASAKSSLRILKNVAKSSCAVIFKDLYIFPQRNNLLSYLNTFKFNCKCKYLDYLIGPDNVLKEPGLKEF